MRIHPVDLAIVVAYLLGVTALGMRFRRGQQAALPGGNEGQPRLFSWWPHGALVGAGFLHRGYGNVDADDHRDASDCVRREI